MFFLQSTGLTKDLVGPHEIDPYYIGSGTDMVDDDEEDVGNTKAYDDDDHIYDDDDRDHDSDDDDEQITGSS